MTSPGSQVLTLVVLKSCPVSFEKVLNLFTNCCWRWEIGSYQIDVIQKLWIQHPKNLQIFLLHFHNLWMVRTFSPSHSILKHHQCLPPPPSNKEISNLLENPKVGDSAFFSLTCPLTLSFFFFCCSKGLILILCFLGSFLEKHIISLQAVYNRHSTFKFNDELEILKRRFSNPVSHGMTFSTLRVPLNPFASGPNHYQLDHFRALCPSDSPGDHFGRTPTRCILPCSVLDFSPAANRCCKSKTDQH